MEEKTKTFTKDVENWDEEENNNSSYNPNRED